MRTRQCVCVCRAIVWSGLLVFTDHLDLQRKRNKHESGGSSEVLAILAILAANRAHSAQSPGLAPQWLRPCKYSWRPLTLCLLAIVRSLGMFDMEVAILEFLLHFLKTWHFSGLLTWKRSNECRPRWNDWIRRQAPRGGGVVTFEVTLEKASLNPLSKKSWFFLEK